MGRPRVRTRQREEEQNNEPSVQAENLSELFIRATTTAFRKRITESLITDSPTNEESVARTRQLATSWVGTMHKFSDLVYTPLLSQETNFEYITRFIGGLKPAELVEQHKAFVEQTHANPSRPPPAKRVAGPVTQPRLTFVISRLCEFVKEITKVALDLLELGNDTAVGAAFQIAELTQQVLEQEWFSSQFSIFAKLISTAALPAELTALDADPDAMEEDEDEESRNVAGTKMSLLYSTYSHVVEADAIFLNDEVDDTYKFIVALVALARYLAVYTLPKTLGTVLAHLKDVHPILDEPEKNQVGRWTKFVQAADVSFQKQPKRPGSVPLPMATVVCHEVSIQAAAFLTYRHTDIQSRSSYFRHLSQALPEFYWYYKPLHKDIREKLTQPINPDLFGNELTGSRIQSNFSNLLQTHMFLSLTDPSVLPLHLFLEGYNKSTIPKELVVPAALASYAFLRRRASQRLLMEAGDELGRMRDELTNLTLPEKVKFLKERLRTNGQDFYALAHLSELVRSYPVIRRDFPAINEDLQNYMNSLVVIGFETALKNPAEAAAFGPHRGELAATSEFVQKCDPVLRRVGNIVAAWRSAHADYPNVHLFIDTFVQAWADLINIWSRFVYAVEKTMENLATSRRIAAWDECGKIVSEFELAVKHMDRTLKGYNDRMDKSRHRFKRIKIDAHLNKADAAYVNFLRKFEASVEEAAVNEAANTVVDQTAARRSAQINDRLGAPGNPRPPPLQTSSSSSQEPPRLRRCSASTGAIIKFALRSIFGVWISHSDGVVIANNTANLALSDYGFKEIKATGLTEENTMYLMHLKAEWIASSWISTEIVAAADSHILDILDDISDDELGTPIKNYNPYLLGMSLAASLTATTLTVTSIISPLFAAPAVTEIMVASAWMSAAIPALTLSAVLVCGVVAGVWFCSNYAGMLRSKGYKLPALAASVYMVSHFVHQRVAPITGVIRGVFYRTAQLLNMTEVMVENNLNPPGVIAEFLSETLGFVSFGKIPKSWRNFVAKMVVNVPVTVVKTSAWAFMVVSLTVAVQTHPILLLGGFVLSSPWWMGKALALLTTVFKTASLYLAVQKNRQPATSSSLLGTGSESSSSEPPPRDPTRYGEILEYHYPNHKWSREAAIMQVTMPFFQGVVQRTMVNTDWTLVS